MARSQESSIAFDIVGVPNLVFAEQSIEDRWVIEFGVSEFPAAIRTFLYHDYSGEVRDDCKDCEGLEGRVVNDNQIEFEYKLAFPPMLIAFYRAYRNPVINFRDNPPAGELFVGMLPDNKSFYSHGLFDFVKVPALPNVSESGVVCLGNVLADVARRSRITFGRHMSAALDRWWNSGFNSDLGDIRDLYSGDGGATFALWERQSKKSVKAGADYLREVTRESDVFALSEFSVSGRLESIKEDFGVQTR